MNDDTARQFPQPVHFVGIGGAGMSGIAMVLAKLGVRVTGSDLKTSRYTRHLEEAGIAVTIGHEAGNLGDAALVVISSAIPEGNPEPVSYTHLRAHETRHDLVCRLLLETKKKNQTEKRQHT